MRFIVILAALLFLGNASDYLNCKFEERNADTPGAFASGTMVYSWLNGVLQFEYTGYTEFYTYDVSDQKGEYLFKSGSNCGGCQWQDLNNKDQMPVLDGIGISAVNDENKYEVVFDQTSADSYPLSATFKEGTDRFFTFSDCSRTATNPSAQAPPDRATCSKNTNSCSGTCCGSCQCQTCASFVPAQCEAPDFCVIKDGGCTAKGCESNVGSSTVDATESAQINALFSDLYFADSQSCSDGVEFVVSGATTLKATIISTYSEVASFGYYISDSFGLPTGDIEGGSNGIIFRNIGDDGCLEEGKWVAIPGLASGSKVRFWTKLAATGEVFYSTPEYCTVIKFTTTGYVVGCRTKLEDALGATYDEIIVSISASTGAISTPFDVISYEAEAVCHEFDPTSNDNAEITFKKDCRDHTVLFSDVPKELTPPAPVTRTSRRGVKTSRRAPKVSRRAPTVSRRAPTVSRRAPKVSRRSPQVSRRASRRNAKPASRRASRRIISRRTSSPSTKQSRRAYAHGKKRFEQEIAPIPYVPPVTDFCTDHGTHRNMILPQGWKVVNSPTDLDNILSNFGAHWSDSDNTCFTAYGLDGAAYGKKTDGSSACASVPSISRIVNARAEVCVKSPCAQHVVITKCARSEGCNPNNYNDYCKLNGEGSTGGDAHGVYADLPYNTDVKIDFPAEVVGDSKNLNLVFVQDNTGITQKECYHIFPQSPNIPWFPKLVTSKLGAFQQKGFNYYHYDGEVKGTDGLSYNDYIPDNACAAISGTNEGKGDLVAKITSKIATMGWSQADGTHKVLVFVSANVPNFINLDKKRDLQKGKGSTTSTGTEVADLVAALKGAQVRIVFAVRDDVRVYYDRLIALMAAFGGIFDSDYLPYAITVSAGSSWAKDYSSEEPLWLRNAADAAVTVMGRWAVNVDGDYYSVASPVLVHGSLGQKDLFSYILKDTTNPDNVGTLEYDNGKKGWYSGEQLVRHAEKKVTVCHQTASTFVNPYRLITVSKNAVGDAKRGHLHHQQTDKKLDPPVTRYDSVLYGIIGDRFGCWCPNYIFDEAGKEAWNRDQQSQITNQPGNVGPVFNVWGKKKVPSVVKVPEHPRVPRIDEALTFANCFGGEIHLWNGPASNGYKVDLQIRRLFSTTVDKNGNVELDTELDLSALTTFETIDNDPTTGVPTDLRQEANWCSLHPTNGFRMKVLCGTCPKYRIYYTVCDGCLCSDEEYHVDIFFSCDNLPPTCADFTVAGAKGILTNIDFTPHIGGNAGLKVGLDELSTNFATYGAVKMDGSDLSVPAASSTDIVTKTGLLGVQTTESLSAVNYPFFRYTVTDGSLSATCKVIYTVEDNMLVPTLERRRNIVTERTQTESTTLIITYNAGAAVELLVYKSGTQFQPIDSFTQFTVASYDLKAVSDSLSEDTVVESGVTDASKTRVITITWTPSKDHADPPAKSTIFFIARDASDPSKISNIVETTWEVLENLPPTNVPLVSGNVVDLSGVKGTKTTLVLGGSDPDQQHKDHVKLKFVTLPAKGTVEFPDGKPANTDDWFTVYHINAQDEQPPTDSRVRVIYTLDRDIIKSDTGPDLLDQFKIYWQDDLLAVSPILPINLNFLPVDRDPLCDLSNSGTHTTSINSGFTNAIFSIGSFDPDQDDRVMTLDLSGITNGGIAEKIGNPSFYSASNPPPAFNFKAPITKKDFYYVPPTSGSAYTEDLLYTITAAGKTINCKMTFVVGDAIIHPPLNADKTYTRVENSPPFTIPLGPLFSDPLDGHDHVLTTLISLPGDDPSDDSKSLVTLQEKTGSKKITLGNCPYSISAKCTDVPSEGGVFPVEAVLKKNSNGRVTFRYHVYDQGGQFSVQSGTITIIVTPFNDPPTVKADPNSITTTRTTREEVTITVTDPDSESVFCYLKQIRMPSASTFGHGDYVFGKTERTYDLGKVTNPNGAGNPFTHTYPVPFHWIVDADAPDSIIVGKFTVYCVDFEGEKSNEDDVELRVEGNLPPVGLSEDTYTVPEGTPFVKFTIFGADPNSWHTMLLDFSADKPLPSTAKDARIVYADTDKEVKKNQWNQDRKGADDKTSVDLIYYPPSLTWSGTHTIDYKWRDLVGAKQLVAKTITIVYTPVNDPPSAFPVKVVTKVDVPKDIILSCQDPEHHQLKINLTPAEIAKLSPASSLVYAGLDVKGRTDNVTLTQGDWKLTYQGPAALVEPTISYCCVEINTAEKWEDCSTIDIEVKPGDYVNLPPTSLDHSYVTDEDKKVTISFGITTEPPFPIGKIFDKDGSDVELTILSLPGDSPQNKIAFAPESGPDLGKLVWARDENIEVERAAIYPRTPKPGDPNHWDMVFIPNPDVSGKTWFYFLCSDKPDGEFSNVAKVTITITAVPDPPFLQIEPSTQSCQPRKSCDFIMEVWDVDSALIFVDIDRIARASQIPKNSVLKIKGGNQNNEIDIEEIASDQIMVFDNKKFGEKMSATIKWYPGVTLREGGGTLTAYAYDEFYPRPIPQATDTFAYSVEAVPPPPPPPAPVCVEVDEDTPSIDIFATASDPDDQDKDKLTCSLTSGTTLGDLSIDGQTLVVKYNANGQIISDNWAESARTNAAGTDTVFKVTYSPYPNANGDDSFTFTCCDETGACTLNIQPICLKSVPDRPWIRDIYVYTDINKRTAFTPPFSYGDNDVGQKLTLHVRSDITAVTTEHQSTVDSSAGLTIVEGAEIPEDFGTWFYTSPVPHAQKTFQYHVCDDTGLCSVPATAYLTVASGPKPLIPPVALNHEKTIKVGESYKVDFNQLNLFSDSDGTVTDVEFVDRPSVLYGAISYESDSTNALRLLFTDSYSFTYTARTTGTEVYTYRVRDNDGETSNVARITINIIAPPVITVIPTEITSGRVVDNTYQLKITDPDSPFVFVELKQTSVPDNTHAFYKLASGTVREITGPILQYARVEMTGGEGYFTPNNWFADYDAIAGEFGTLTWGAVDSFGLKAEEDAVLRLIVGPNSAPVFRLPSTTNTYDFTGLTEDKPQLIDIWTFDPNYEHMTTLKLTVFSLPSKGKLYYPDGSEVGQGDVLDVAQLSKTDVSPFTDACVQTSGVGANVMVDSTICSLAAYGLKYVPSAHFLGSVSFFVEAEDILFAKTRQEITLEYTVDIVNPPTSGDKNLYTKENACLTFAPCTTADPNPPTSSICVSDPENKPTTTVVILDPVPDKGIISRLVDGVYVPITSSIEIEQATADCLPIYYQPPRGEFSPPNVPFVCFDFKVRSPTGLESEVHKYCIYVLPVNDPPVGCNQEITIPRNTIANFDLSPPCTSDPDSEFYTIQYERMELKGVWRQTDGGEPISKVISQISGLYPVRYEPELDDYSIDAQTPIGILYYRVVDAEGLPSIETYTLTVYATFEGYPPRVPEEVVRVMLEDTCILVDLDEKDVNWFEFEGIGEIDVTTATISDVKILQTGTDNQGKHTGKFFKCNELGTICTEFNANGIDDIPGGHLKFCPGPDEYDDFFTTFTVTIQPYHNGLVVPPVTIPWTIHVKPVNDPPVLIPNFYTPADILEFNVSNWCDEDEYIVVQFEARDVDSPVDSLEATFTGFLDQDIIGKAINCNAFDDKPVPEPEVPGWGESYPGARWNKGKPRPCNSGDELVAFQQFEKIGPALWRFVFIPFPDFNGFQRLGFYVKDDKGRSSEPDTICPLTVYPINDPPKWDTHTTTKSTEEKVCANETNADTGEIEPVYCNITGVLLTAVVSDIDFSFDLEMRLIGVLFQATFIPRPEWAAFCNWTAEDGHMSCVAPIQTINGFLLRGIPMVLDQDAVAPQGSFVIHDLGNIDKWNRPLWATIVTSDELEEFVPAPVVVGIVAMLGYTVAGAAASTAAAAGIYAANFHRATEQVAAYFDRFAVDAAGQAHCNPLYLNNEMTGVNPCYNEAGGHGMGRGKPF